MTKPIQPLFHSYTLEKIQDIKGALAICVDSADSLGTSAKRVNRLMKGTIKRFAESDSFAKMKQGDVKEFPAPLGLNADVVLVLKLTKRPSIDLACQSGAALAKIAGNQPLHLFMPVSARIIHIVFGYALRQYDFNIHKTKDKSNSEPLNVYVKDVEKSQEKYNDLSAVVNGVFFTRDLVNEPANILTTENFAARLLELRDFGLTLKVLEEKDMHALGMHALLGVGMGSNSPSKIVIMEWKGGGDEPPFALIGKGVVFDTGGISLKPAGGMEDMTMDMGGAGVVAGVMKTLAIRKAKANVVALVGLVENMPDANAQRPGDVVKSMKGETIEVINTDAEGRLVLADVLWYAQETYNPSAMIDLATLTGAIIVSLGHENAGVFSNNDTLCTQFLKSAQTETEGAWRMPLGAAYDKMIKSHIADIKNVGGRDAGAITAAQFLHRFVKKDVPWIHLDIAGVAAVKAETTFAPKGATGWGVRTINRLISDCFES